MKKLLKRASVMILTLGLVLGSLGISPATVAAYDATTLSTSAVLTKELKIPQGTQAPITTYAFTVTPVGVADYQGNLDTSETGPAFSIPSISFVNGDVGIANGNIEKSTADIVPAIKTAGFTHAGVYFYTVTETQGSLATIDYSEAVYTIQVHVINTSGGLSVEGITVAQDKNDIGTNTGDKVNPVANPTHSAFRFTNVYSELTNVKVANNIPDSYGNRSKDFNFTIGITLPAGSTVTTVPYTTTAGGSGNVAITAGAGSVNVTLKHGQSIDFTGLPVGSIYTVTETNVPAGYTPSAVVTGTGTNGTSPAGGIGTGSNNYAVTVNSSANLQVGAETDSVKNVTTVTNSYSDINITGLLIDNLPFILLIGVTLAGLTLFVVKRRRRASN